MSGNGPAWDSPAKFKKLKEQECSFSLAPPTEEGQRGEGEQCGCGRLGNGIEGDASNADSAAGAAADSILVVDADEGLR